MSDDSKAPEWPAPSVDEDGHYVFRTTGEHPTTVIVDVDYLHRLLMLRDAWKKQPQTSGAVDRLNMEIKRIEALFPDYPMH